MMPTTAARARSRWLACAAAGFLLLATAAHPAVSARQSADGATAALARQSAEGATALARQSTEGATAAAAQTIGLGAIAFPTSGSVAAQPDFLRGVAALHTFEYEDANEAFLRAQKIDSRFVMAYWGEAMTYYQPLWRNENVEAARQALARLRSTRTANAEKPGTPKERAFLAAVEILFGAGDAATRHRNYADAMARMHASDPDDPEVASFHALALLGTVSRSLIGYMDEHEGHSQTLAGSEIQKQVATVLAGVLESHPQHPGALHYLLHDYDDPEHARLALPAARTFAKMAPDSSHALHMPAHIFLQLGMWHDAASSDRAAFAASNTWIARKGLSATMRNYHALSWLQYELLQLGRYREAWDTINELAPVVKASGQVTLLSDLSSMRARYVIEARRWDVLAGERNFGNVNELFAIGVSAARSGNPALAEMARQALAERVQSEREGDLRPAIAIMEREVTALIELAAGRRDRAVEILRAATDAELRLPPPFGLPAPVKPAPELLGEVLLEIGRPGDAIQPFEQALRRNANRSLSILGLARAAAVLGHTDTARQRYGELLANFDHADVELPELKEARAALEDARRTNVPASRLPVGAVPIALGVALSVAAAFAIRQSIARRRAAAHGSAGVPRSERRRRARRHP